MKQIFGGDGGKLGLKLEFCHPWSYKIGSGRLTFCLSFHLSVSFLGIGSLFFSETWC